MSWTKVIAPFACTAILALAWGCGGGGLATPTPTATGTATQNPKRSADAVRWDCLSQFPLAILTGEAQTQVGVRASVNWHSGRCNVDAHGFGELRAPAQPLALGGEPRLLLNRAPDVINVEAWMPDFSVAKPASFGNVEMPYPAGIPRDGVAVMMLPSISERLDLRNLPAGEYALSVRTQYADGQSIFIFRVAVEPPPVRNP